jgi:hypothetical protein
MRIMAKFCKGDMEGAVKACEAIAQSGRVADYTEIAHEVAREFEVNPGALIDAWESALPSIEDVATSPAGWRAPEIGEDDR